MVNLFQQLPLGRSDFPALLDSNAIYVDKTEMVCRLAENDDKLFSRPRRFGKSLLVSTFETLFKNGLTAFKGLAIEKLWLRHLS
ncbi:MAG TPA: AAA family ATPase [Candidatus Duodenibacillus intestinavium]|nr:AAA family ATPase [Candidatus Duodenibacillus intestinavium]